MLRLAAICCLLLAAISTAAVGAQRRAPQKSETLACRLGTEDRHARIAVVLVGGKTDSFAYYSKWKPRTCSIYLQRDRDAMSKWADSGNITTVNLERGAFLIEHKKGEYHFVFRDIDRERYCGMDGQINGSLTIRKGSDQCKLDGAIMEEGTPLGKAFVNMEPELPPPAQRSEQPAAPATATNPDAAAAPQSPQGGNRTNAGGDEAYAGNRAVMATSDTRAAHEPLAAHGGVVEVAAVTPAESRVASNEKNAEVPVGRTQHTVVEARAEGPADLTRSPFYVLFDTMSHVRPSETTRSE
jgi:hypothetical protein